MSRETIRATKTVIVKLLEWLFAQVKLKPIDKFLLQSKFSLSHDLMAITNDILNTNNFNSSINAYFNSLDRFIKSYFEYKYYKAVQENNENEAKKWSNVPNIQTDIEFNALRIIRDSKMNKAYSKGNKAGKCFISRLFDCPSVCLSILWLAFCCAYSAVL